MLTLRLSRAGTKKRPVYHLVAADQRARRDGRFVENLGYYIPATKVLVLKQDRIQYWQGVGARTTETAKRLILRAQKHGNTEIAVRPKAAPPPPPKKPEAKAEKAEAKAEKAEPAEKAEAKAETAEAKVEAPPAAEPAEGAKPEESGEVDKGQ